ncbi:DMT family transporter [Nocardioides pakistanensis]
MAQLSSQADPPTDPPTGQQAARAGRPFTSALLVLSGASLFGTVGTAQALGPDVPAGSLAATRLLLTAVVFVLVAVATGQGAGIRPALRTAPAWLAGLGQGAFNLFFLAAMKETGVAIGTLVAIGATPVLTGLIARHVSRLWLGATAVAVAGLGLLVTGQQGGATASGAGVALALGAAASYATYIVAGNAAEVRGTPTQPFLAAAFTVSALLTLPWLLVGDLGWVTGGGGLVLGYLVAVPTVLAYSLFNRGLRGVRSSTASTLALVEPVVAASLAYLLLGERLGATGLVGAAMILLGLLLIVRSTASPEKTSGPA